MDWIQQWQSKLNKQNGVAPLVRTGGSRHTGLAALPYRNIHRTVIFIVECAHNMDNGYVEVWFTDGNMLRIKCEEVEAALRTTEQSLAKLHKLLDNKPIEYVAMALSGEMQAYCDIEDEMVKGMFGTIVQGYLKKGYNRATAEMMAREFFRYES